MTGFARPINLRGWIDANRDRLKPPVGNQQVWEDRDFLVTVVGGPNSRTDFHVNEGEEFFHQLEGDITLRVLVDGKFEDLPIREGEIFLLPPRVPHSPRRPAGTVGLVIERKRAGEEVRKPESDGFMWFCEGCGAKLHEEFFHLTDIVRQLPPAFDRFWTDPAKTTCRACGRAHARPGPATR